MLVTVLKPDREAVLAQLATTAYQVALRHGFKGSFADLELELWRELRAACQNVDFVKEGDTSWRP
jgi:hypothetical protein